MYQYIEWVTLAFIPGFILLDMVYRHRRYAVPPFWRLRAAAITVGIFFFSSFVVVFWAKLLGDFHLIDGRGLGAVGGAVVGVLVYELLHYGYHRAAHEWKWLWRAGHQMHHSAESLDAFGAYYLHPFDAFMFTTWSSLVFYPLLGLTVEAGILGALFLTFNAMFQHANIKTPHWLGYVIQRPESHNIHHGKDIHRYNYADLPVVDMLFGTFRNPKSLESTECGFYPGASSKLIAMFFGRDVSRPGPGKVAASPAGEAPESAEPLAPREAA
jgi:sterol desaturase/sphingolipid hydroxylase (fatty acid hydroxylase superfamily)